MEKELKEAKEALAKALKEIEALRQVQDDLKASNSKLIDENGVLKKDNEALQQAHDDLKKAQEDKEEAVKLAQESLRQAQGDNDELNDLVEQLQTANAEGTVMVTNSDVIVTDGKNQYKVLAKRLKHKNKEYSAEELEKNPEVVKDLIKIKSGVLKKLKKSN